MKRKFLVILLLFFFVAPLATTFVILQFQKEQVKEEIKRKLFAGIDKEELVLLKFTEEEKRTQLDWEDSKEFEYRGEMYDVVEIEVNYDTTYYWCLFDYEETGLNKRLDELVLLTLGNNPKNQENQKILNIFFRSLYFSEFIVKEPFPSPEIKSNSAYYADFYQSQFFIPLVPPPKII